MRKSVIAVGFVVALLGCKRGPEKVEPMEGEGAESQNVACGKTVCSGGQVCCNPSCGLCAPPDGMCTQQFCDAPVEPDGGVEELPAAPMTCDNVRCAGGTHCEMVEVQCIKAPCPPIPECKPDEQKN